jgi:hypothetical protein
MKNNEKHMIFSNMDMEDLKIQIRIRTKIVQFLNTDLNKQ